MIPDRDQDIRGRLDFAVLRLREVGASERWVRHYICHQDACGRVSELVAL